MSNIKLYCYSADNEYQSKIKFYKINICLYYTTIKYIKQLYNKN